MTKLRALAVALLMMSVIQSHHVGAQDRAMIVGTWKVISEEIQFQDNGERLAPLGAHPRGYLIFTPQGRMMFYVEAEGRKAPTTDEQRLAAYLTLNAYTGTYRVEGNKWITRVDGAWNVEWVGTEQERTFDLKGHKLSVTTPWIPNPLRGGRLFRGYVTFERED